MFNKLNLSLFFGFFPAYPIAVMQVFAPQLPIVGACTVVVISDYFFIGIARCFTGHDQPLAFTPIFLPGLLVRGWRLARIGAGNFVRS